MFLASNFVEGRAPRIFYKAHLDCDRVAKFHGDRPRELGDVVAKKIKKKKNVTGKT